MGFTESFIDALTKGREHAHRLKLQEWEEEDRGIHKDVLAHSLKELKIQDRIRARNAAISNLEQMQGQPESSFPQQATDEDMTKMTPGLPGTVPPEGMVPHRAPDVDIPGIDELGVPGVKVKPQTLEQVLAAQLAELKQKAMWTAGNVPRGGRRVVPGLADENNPDGVIAEGDKIPETLHPYTNRDVSGKETTEYLTSEELAKRPPAVKNRLPARPSSGGSANRLDDDERAEVVAGMIDGSLPADQIPNTTEGLRIRSALKKSGFNLTTAQNDLKAYRTYLTGLNQGQQQQVLQSSDAVLDALDVLDGVVAAQGDGAKVPGTKPYADLDAAVKAVQAQLVHIKGGGNVSADKAIELAEKQLATGWTGKGVGARAKALRQALQYRVASIKGAFTSTADTTSRPGGKTTTVEQDPLGLNKK